MRLGVHVSIADKIYNSIDRAKALGCNTMQIFSRSPREFRGIPLRIEDCEEFKRRRKKSGIKPIFIHMPYLVNLASPDNKLYRTSIKLYIDSIKDAEALGAEYIVTHMGSHKGSGEENGLRRFSRAINTIFDKTKDSKVSILLENTSGSGFSIGHNFKQQKRVIDQIEDKSRIGICLDTCHAFTAGYDIATKEGSKETVAQLDEQVGLKYLKLIHLNDARDDFGTLRDRHEHIGKGKIGLEGFRNIVNHPKLKNVPFVLETPKASEEDDKMNLKTVKKLRK
ncbi:MAG: deoxyribonuclease IV [Candidatus Omnitrophica bacterium]|nr:deoxyribonuclease IV [Candidatus Omnitrophota bacterium]HOX54822.1 deoxyribonuclease IV [Candidatus Omnitrophota bacterium]